MSTTVKAVLVMCLAMCLIPVGDTAGKTLAETGVAPVFIAWSRFWLGGLVLAVSMMRGTRVISLLRDARVWLRGALIAAGISCILTAMRTEPIATVFAAFFIGPILSYFLSAVLLKEAITWPRTALLFVGFIGVLLVVKPGFGASLGILWAVLAGLFYGSFLVASRWLAGIGSSKDLMMSQLIVGAILLTPLGALAIPEMSHEVVVLTFFSAVCSLAGNLLLLVAYRMLDAARLAPLVYVQLISATICGAAFFGDWPDGVALLGLALLLGSGFGSFAVRQR